MGTITLLNFLLLVSVEQKSRSKGKEEMAVARVKTNVFINFLCLTWLLPLCDFQRSNTWTALDANCWIGILSHSSKQLTCFFPSPNSCLQRQIQGSESQYRPIKSPNAGSTGAPTRPPQVSQQEVNLRIAFPLFHVELCFGFYFTLFTQTIFGDDNHNDVDDDDVAVAVRSGLIRMTCKY